MNMADLEDYFSLQTGGAIHFHVSSRECTWRTRACTWRTFKKLTDVPVQCRGLGMAAMSLL